MAVSFLLVVIVIGSGLPILVGLGLLSAAFVRTATWGWRPAMADRPDGRWSLTRRMMWAGAAALGIGLVPAVAIVGWLTLVSA